MTQRSGCAGTTLPAPHADLLASRSVPLAADKAQKERHKPDEGPRLQRLMRVLERGDITESPSNFEALVALESLIENHVGPAKHVVTNVKGNLGRFLVAWDGDALTCK